SSASSLTASSLMRERVSIRAGRCVTDDILQAPGGGLWPRQARGLESRPMAAPEVRALRGAAALSEDFFRPLADSIPPIVWRARPDGHNDYHNRRFLDYSGMTQAEISGWGWEKFIHPEDRDRCHECWQRSLETGEPFELEYRLRRRDGVFLWHLGSAYPVRE